MGKQVVYFSRFVLDENAGGGGCKREAQLGEVLQPLAYEFLNSRESPWMTNQVSELDQFILGLFKRFHPYKNFWFDFYIDSVFKMRAISKEWIRKIKTAPGIKLAIVDDPIYFYPLVEYLSRCRVPIVGLCQNIESLSFSQLNPAHQLKLFNKEMALFQECALVVAISREETYLFKNFDIPAYYLPYYPVQSIEKRMLKVRAIREKRRQVGRSSKDLLVLGTAGNKVTLDGMIALIEFWKSPRNKNKNDKLYVGGYWTEQLLKTEGGRNVELLGTLSNNDLDELLSRVKCMICYQEYGSGALTKIKEMAIAGVPVLANPHAARSYYGNPGLLEFEHLGDLPQAITKLDDMQVHIPLPDKKQIAGVNRELVEKITALLNTK